MAREIVNLFLDLIPSMYELVDEATMLKLIVNALRAVLPCCPPTLGRLMTVIADRGNLMERLTSDCSSSEVMKDWARESRNTVRDALTLEMWTGRVVEMTSSCRSDHGIADEIQRWSALISLKRALIDLEHMHTQQTDKSKDQLPTRYLPPLARMTQLTKDDRNRRAGQQEHNQDIPELKDKAVELLGEFDLPVPVSWRMLRNTIEILDSEKTIAILCTAVETFPCRLCNDAARHVSWPVGGANSATRDDDAQAMHKPGPDVLGKRMGTWKVLLSKQALKSMQNLNRSGFAPATLTLCLEQHS